MFIETTTRQEPQDSILELLHRGDFEEAQEQLNRMGNQCLADPENYSLVSAYFDLCACAALHATLAHTRPVDVPAPDTLRSV
jgi:hypothetical protein